MIYRFASLSAVLLTACAQQPPAPTSPPAAELPSASCYASGSRDWAAWVNAMPGPGTRPTLIVTGKVDTPTGGNRVSFEPSLQIRESYPVQAVATLRITSAGDTAAMAVTAHDVRGEWPATQPIGSVTVRCGDRTLAVISPVETAH